MVALQSEDEAREDPHDEDDGEADGPLFVKGADDASEELSRTKRGQKRVRRKEREIAQS